MPGVYTKYANLGTAHLEGKLSPCFIAVVIKRHDMVVLLSQLY